MRNRKTFLAAAVVALVALSGAVRPAWAQAPLSEEQLLERIEKGGSAADYKALAAYYHGEAAATQKMATEHEAMAQRFANVGGKGDWATHCRSLVSYYQKEAAEYRMLAEMNDKEAAAAGN